MASAHQPWETDSFPSASNLNEQTVGIPTEEQLGFKYFARCMILGPARPSCVFRDESTFSPAQLVLQAIFSSAGSQALLSEIFQYVTDNSPAFLSQNLLWRRNIVETLSTPAYPFVEIPCPLSDHKGESLWTIDEPDNQRWIEFAFAPPQAAPLHPPQLSPAAISAESHLHGLWDQLSNKSKSAYREAAFLERFAEDMNFLVNIHA